MPTSVPPSQIDISVPTEEEVKWEGQRLRENWSMSTSWMRAENLQEWLQEHRSTEAAAEVEAEGETSDPEGRERDTEERIEDGGEGRETTKWEMVMELVQMAFREGVLAEEAVWQAVVLIPKGRGDY